MTNQSADRLITNSSTQNYGAVGGPPGTGFFHGHHDHHHHAHHQQQAVAEAAFCASVCCCAQASDLCSQANDPSNGCMKRTCAGTGATFCGILGTLGCFFACLSLCTSDEDKSSNHHHHHHHHGHHGHS